MAERHVGCRMPLHRKQSNNPTSGAVAEQMWQQLVLVAFDVQLRGDEPRVLLKFVEESRAVNLSHRFDRSARSNTPERAPKMVALIINVQLRRAIAHTKGGARLHVHTDTHFAALRLQLKERLGKDRIGFKAVVAGAAVGPQASLQRLSHVGFP